MEKTVKMYRFVFSDGYGAWNLYKGKESDEWIQEMLKIFKNITVEWEG